MTAKWYYLKHSNLSKYINLTIAYKQNTGYVKAKNKQHDENFRFTDGKYEDL